MKKYGMVVLSFIAGLCSFAAAQDTTITFNLLPSIVGGSPTSATTLEQPIAVHFTIKGLEPNTNYNQAHMGFLTKNTSTVRGSKWTVNGWISPSTVLPYKQSDSQGWVSGWAFLRTPSSYIIGIDTAQIRIRVQKEGSSVNVTFNSDPLSSLNIAASATGASVGSIIYGYVDSTMYGGKIVVAYADTGARPLSSWFVLPAKDQWTDDFFTTRMDTTLRKGGYFQLVVPVHQKIAKIEIRDTLNAVVKTWTSTQWTSGAVGTKTEINFSLSAVRIEEGIHPADYSLDQNYPNPFNPTTKIRFSLKHSGTAVLKVYDLLGKELATLVNEYLPAGTFSAAWDAKQIPSGMYFYSLRTDSFVETKRMLLLK